MVGKMNHKLGICFALALLSLVPSKSSAQMLNKDDLLAAVEANRSSIQDMEVTFSFIMTKGRFDGPDAKVHTKVICKGSKTYINEEYGASVPGSSPTFNVEAAYNGERSTEYARHIGEAN